MDGLTIQPDSLQNHSTPKLSSKPLPNGVSVNGKAKAAPAVETSARIDLRPLYVALKDAVGENWASYKEAVKEFMLGERNALSYYLSASSNTAQETDAFFPIGQLNQVELSLRIDHFICISPDREHLHNNLVAAIFGNATRAEAPDSGIASWVSANDKPTAVSKPVSGDVAEQRLKTEVMHLTARERRRLKGIVEVASQSLVYGGSDRSPLTPRAIGTLPRPYSAHSDLPHRPPHPSSGHHTVQRRRRLQQDKLGYRDPTTVYTATLQRNTRTPRCRHAHFPDNAHLL